jgi:UDP-N-acetylbacillosamine N-acetyltransferase
VVAEAASLAGYHIAGFADANRDKVGQQVDRWRVVVTQDDLLASILAATPLPAEADAIALGFGGNHDREALLTGLARADVPNLFPPIVHPSAVVSPSAHVGPATVLLPRAVVHTGARLGTGVILNSGAIVEHDCRVDDFVHLAPGAIVCGGVSVGARTWIGSGATVIHARKVGADCIVGAGSVVIRDVPDGSVAVGVPARPRPRNGSTA